jgi:hypothetical protein
VSRGQEAEVSRGQEAEVSRGQEAEVSRGQEAEVSRRQEAIECQWMIKSSVAFLQANFSPGLAGRQPRQERGRRDPARTGRGEPRGHAETEPRGHAAGRWSNSRTLSPSPMECTAAGAVGHLTGR